MSANDPPDGVQNAESPCHHRLSPTSMFHLTCSLTPTGSTYTAHVSGIARDVSAQLTQMRCSSIGTMSTMTPPTISVAHPLRTESASDLLQPHVRQTVRSGALSLMCVDGFPRPPPLTQAHGHQSRYGSC